MNALSSPCVDRKPHPSGVRRPAAIVATALVAIFVLFSNAAQAQPTVHGDHASPEHFTFEARIGAHTVGGNTTDLGPMLGAELHYHIWRIPYVGPIGIGLGLGVASYSGTLLVSVPILASLRVDVLARMLDIPLVVVGKFGYDSVIYAGQYAPALRWGAQLALELDIFEPRAARALDEEWGINHSFIFFELYGNVSLGSVDVSAIAWAAGLGVTF